jgi:large subunit ribosomal protein L17
MRHGKKVNHLGRKTAHRRAMLANMACSLIEHKRINTTVAKAKALKQFIEPLITKSKAENNQSMEKVLITEESYLKILEINMQGDNADMAMIELVDFNEIYNAGKAKKKKTTRRGRTSKKAEAPAEVTAETEVAVEEATEVKTPKAKTPKEETPKADAPEAKDDTKTDDSKE